ncbi:MAG: hypothetical protein L0220_15915 [Acidobacteria bacterium]|nr:hypothetical protein [Acidobacteriota bacterium]
MEDLKHIDDVCKPDIRQQYLFILDEDLGQVRPMKVEDYHKAASRIRLHDGVPEDVRNHFATAQNLVVYSWFYYPFNVSAELQALASVEFALKIKANARIPLEGSPPGLKKLLERAIKEGWISDDNFSEIHAMKTQTSGKLSFKTLDGELVESYCHMLKETLPKLRNILAHGESILHGQGATYVWICAEIINQLFENCANNSSTDPMSI